MKLTHLSASNRFFAQIAALEWKEDRKGRVTLSGTDTQYRARAARRRLREAKA